VAVLDRKSFSPYFQQMLDMKLSFI
jgi:hypothetical protein